MHSRDVHSYETGCPVPRVSKASVPNHLMLFSYHRTGFGGTPTKVKYQLIDVGNRFC